MRINRQQFWTEQSPSLSQDSNPTCPDTIPLLYHLCRRLCQDYKPVSRFNESFLLTRSSTEATSNFYQCCFISKTYLITGMAAKFFRSCFLSADPDFWRKLILGSLFWNWNKRDWSQLIWSQSRQKWPKIFFFFFWWLWRPLRKQRR